MKPSEIAKLITKSYRYGHAEDFTEDVYNQITKLSKETMYSVLMIICMKVEKSGQGLHRSMDNTAIKEKKKCTNCGLPWNGFECNHCGFDTSVPEGVY